MCIHIEWFRNQKSQRVTLVSKARYLNSKKDIFLENIHGHVCGHFVREPFSMYGQNDKKEPDGPEFVSTKKRYLLEYMIIGIIKYPQLIIFKNLIVSLYDETNPFLIGEVFNCQLKKEN